MANQISMVKRNDILTRCKYGFFQREVARKLSIHRHTVGRYVRLAQEEAKVSPTFERANFRLKI